MLVYVALFTTIMLALLAAFLVRRSVSRGKKGMWHGTLLAICLMSFIHLYGAWVFLSVYAKYLFDALFVIVALQAVGKSPNARKVSTGRAVVNLLLSAALIVMSILYFTGTAGKPYGTAHLAPPFKKGSYFVFQGGRGLPTNLFHYKLRTAFFAMDIVKLNRFGNRAGHIASHRLGDYEIFGDTIYSPCSGRIVHIADGNPDNIPPHLTRTAGGINMVLIETDSMYVFLGHLKQHGVFVRPGEIVTTGQPIGFAGNSGFSLEPHLHIQAHAKTDPRKPWYREPPLLIAFNGKSYLLFETIEVQ